MEFKEVLAHFGVSESESTDPNNYLVEVTIEDFLRAASTIAEKLAEVSAENEQNKELLSAYREAVTEAYVAALNGDANECKHALQKVVNT